MIGRIDNGAAEILINPEQFAETRARLLKSHANMFEAYKKIVLTNDNLSRAWDGQAGSRFDPASKALENAFWDNNAQLHDMIREIDITEKGFSDLDVNLGERFSAR